VTVPKPPTITVSVAPVTVTAASPATVIATVQTAAGAGIPGQVVQFTTPGNLGRFSATSALTNASGVATVTLLPATQSTNGADSVVAASTVSGTALTATAGFQLTATDVTIATFSADVGATALSPYGQTTLTVGLAGGTTGIPVNISISSACVSQGLATLTPPTATTSNGSATFTFRDNGCGANLRDALQASVVGSSSTRALQLNLTAPTVASISFISAAPTTIFLRGSGYVENSTVTFRVQDAGGNGVRGQSVQIAPTTLAGGLLVDGLGSASDFPLTKQTDSNGNVVIRVNSGTVPTPVRIQASMTVAGVPISTVSSTLGIAVGLPSQLNFSLAQRTSNIEALDIDGTNNTYTIIASDRLGNPVPDGTAINFVTEGGQIQPIRFTATTTNGLSNAVASFQSSSPRPADGRVTVLAYALGEKSFLDADGNNVYTVGTPGELFQDVGDPYLDRLFNGFFGSAVNQFFAQTPTGTLACASSISPLLATDRSIPNRTNTCTGLWGRSYVRRAAETIFSSSSARPVWGTSLPSGASVSASLSCPVGRSMIIPNSNVLVPAYDSNGTPRTALYFDIGSTSIYLGGGNRAGVLAFFAADANAVAFNPLAAGTTVTASATTGLTATVVGGSPVPSTTAPSSVAIRYEFDTETVNGTVTLVFTSPSGLATTVSQFISATNLPGTQRACP